MKELRENYDLYFRFIEEALPCGFMDIDRMSPSMMKLEQLTKTNNQFFLVSDLIQLKIIYISNRSVAMTGVDPCDFDYSVFLKYLHADDHKRYISGQTKLFSLGHRIYIEKKGCVVISTSFRLKNSLGVYVNTLYQYYLFFSNVPRQTVYVFQVLTDISWFKHLIPGYHFYIGHDSSFFRYPDEYLLQMGNIFAPGNLRSLN